MSPGSDAAELQEIKSPARHSLWDTCCDIELAVVRQQARLGRQAYLRPFVLALNQLGNGWLYPFLAVLLLWAVPDHFLTIVAATCMAAGLGHLIYPCIKRTVARVRPCDLDPTMPPLLKVLDRYSFPSGHCMTIAAVSLPIVIVQPAWLLPAAVACALIAWARMLAAHHYPTDILAGIALGALAALPAIAVLL